MGRGGLIRGAGGAPSDRSRLEGVWGGWGRGGRLYRRGGSARRDPTAPPSPPSAGRRESAGRLGGTRCQRGGSDPSPPPPPLKDPLGPRGSGDCGGVQWGAGMAATPTPSAQSLSPSEGRNGGGGGIGGLWGGGPRWGHLLCPPPLCPPSVSPRGAAHSAAPPRGRTDRSPTHDAQLRPPVPHRPAFPTPTPPPHPLPVAVGPPRLPPHCSRTFRAPFALSFPAATRGNGARKGGGGDGGEVRRGVPAGVSEPPWGWEGAPNSPLWGLWERPPPVPPTHRQCRTGQRHRDPPMRPPPH